MSQSALCSDKQNCCSNLDSQAASEAALTMAHEAYDYSGQSRDRLISADSCACKQLGQQLNLDPREVLH